MLIRSIILWGFCLALPCAGAAQSAHEIAVARQVLADAQARSVAENREFCGYIGYTAAGRLATTKARRGYLNYCEPRWPERLRVVASWHTHGAYDDDAWSEVPTVNDLRADKGEGINGYIGTPAGRLWFLDTRRMEVRQLCGPGCIPADPGHVMGAEGPIARSYTLRELMRREAAQFP
ncbi:hypothetical protein FIU86_01835 [Roseovarius sp. THAF9]|uniref:DUF4329 domain-containing protein n=1 Tax=Roseovarius sp. THAF9 TaxID=2587847 RepID=UPI0012684241|nr:DUF4329 domain-containing protein [Roseovarius sp. THAF9]QFT91563.1 hypothetical protein FIU86_01835 [Roseovarius sp. THAF9]